MKYNRVISTAVLLLLLGTTIPAFAHKDDEKKGGGAGKPQASQHEQQPQHAQKVQPQQHAQKAAQPQREPKAQPQRAEKAQPHRSEKAQPQRTEKAQSHRAEKAQPQRAEKAQSQRAEKAQPLRAEKAQSQRAERAQRQAQPSRGQQTQSVASSGGGGRYGRISNANYSAHFGHGHSFHMGRPQMIGGYNRFQYGGYSFGYNEGWPVGWDYNDDCYVEYVDGAYFMYNFRHPGMHISLSIFGDGNYGNRYGRISEVSYRSHFGHDHWFRMGRPRMIGGYSRFHYGGYWFGYNEGWPVGWDYNDHYYVAYVDGVYYMYNLRHPGIHVTLRMFS